MICSKSWGTDLAMVLFSLQLTATTVKNPIIKKHPRFPPLSRSARGFIRQKGPDVAQRPSGAGMAWHCLACAAAPPPWRDLSFPGGGAQPEPSSSSRLGGDSSETSSQDRYHCPGNCLLGLLPVKATGLWAKPASDGPLALFSEPGSSTSVSLLP